MGTTASVEGVAGISRRGEASFANESLRRVVDMPRAGWHSLSVPQMNRRATLPRRL
jgi:hypothetical protein